jgi:hypothetical protein
MIVKFTSQALRDYAASAPRLASQNPEARLLAILSIGTMYDSVTLADMINADSMMPRVTIEDVESILQRHIDNGTLERIDMVPRIPVIGSLVPKGGTPYGN